VKIHIQTGIASFTCDEYCFLLEL